MIGKGIGPIIFFVAVLLAWAAIQGIRETGKVHPAHVVLLFIAFILLGYLFIGIAAY